MLASRPAIEWIIDRYRVKTDKASGIVNDPNDWSREVGDPRYILDLLARIVTVSLETVTIVDSLPLLNIRAKQDPGASARTTSMRAQRPYWRPKQGPGNLGSARWVRRIRHRWFEDGIAPDPAGHEGGATQDKQVAFPLRATCLQVPTLLTHSRPFSARSTSHSTSDRSASCRQMVLEGESATQLRNQLTDMGIVAIMKEL